MKKIHVLGAQCIVGFAEIAVKETLIVRITILNSFFNPFLAKTDIMLWGYDDLEYL